MSSERTGLLATGAAMLVASVLVPLLMFANFDASFRGVMETFTAVTIVAPVLFVIGLTLTIAGASQRSDPQPQPAPQPAPAQGQAGAASTTCNGCGADVSERDAYCIECGRRVADGA